MTLAVYIAGASKEPERVRRAMDRVRSIGSLALTLDWLAEIEKAGTASEGLSNADRRRYARDDLDAIDRADVVWLLAPANSSVGAFVELGYALRGHKTIVISGPHAARSIFCALGVEVDSDDEALAFIHRRAVGG